MTKENCENIVDEIKAVERLLDHSLEWLVPHYYDSRTPNLQARIEAEGEFLKIEGYLDAIKVKVLELKRDMIQK